MITIVDNYDSFSYNLYQLIGSVLPDVRVVRTVDSDEIMAVQHVARPLFGVQLHPESILSPQGETMLRNFIAVVDRFGDRRSA
ncbi:Glutamine amidotransferase class-I [Bifidobacterium commune]|uniref:Glutamine amidotransferase class-I n=1 Tax=Bifidobacterium commune TaxID=1505727 RepID=A0A1C4H5A1_9BIFI|nr:hypothetical protein [Bifidobacterium commune]SCC80097.1 Glutamine amidotransferase class-I [Bifidobacterium commune]